ncbi:MAG: ABC transporter substrate-binding protein [Sulfurimonas sp.]|nr:MAG: ABC transporter substrate-binding protein [Sulfurimonas sp.]
MRFILIFILFIVYVQAKTILVINSNSEISKYKETELAFRNSFKGEFSFLDISKMSKDEIKKYLYDEYPNIVYTIGTRAYKYVYKYIPEKKVFFSSIVNWKRLPKKKHFSGVLVELHSGMQLTMINSLCLNIKTFGIVYSHYSKDVVSAFINSAKNMNFNIVGQEIKSIKDINIDKLLNKSDSLILIADPIVISDKNTLKNIFKTAKKLKKPIFAYDKIFLKYGAMLSISVDNPTIGRQIATMIKSYLDKKYQKNIQYPVGSHVVFNKKVAEELKIELSNNKINIIDEFSE